MSNEKDKIQHLIPANTANKYKEAIKLLVTNNASFEFVCIGCDISTKEDILILKDLLKKIGKESLIGNHPPITPETLN